MGEKKNKLIVFGVVMLGITAVVASVISLKPIIQEQYWIWQLDSKDEEVQKHAAKNLGDMGSIRAIPRLMELFEEKPFTRKEVAPEGAVVVDSTGRQSRAYSNVLCFSADALIQIGREAVPALVEKLQPGHAEFRKALVMALAEIGPDATQAVPALTKRLKDDSEDVRRQSANALASIGPEARSAVPALSKAMNNDAKDVRWSAAAALAKIGPGVQGTVSALVKSLKHQNDDQRWIGVYGLRKMGSGAVDAIPALIEALKDKNENVRYYAAITLGQIGPKAKGAIPVLETMKGDKSGGVQIAVGEALHKIRGGKSNREAATGEQSP